MLLTNVYNHRTARRSACLALLEVLDPVQQNVLMIIYYPEVIWVSKLFQRREMFYPSNWSPELIFRNDSACTAADRRMEGCDSPSGLIHINGLLLVVMTSHFCIAKRLCCSEAD